MKNRVLQLWRDDNPGHLLIAGLIAVLGVWLYAPGLQYPLVYSDQHWFSAENIASLGELKFRPRYFSKKLARVVFLAGGGNVLYLHVLAIGLHVLAGLAVYALSLCLLRAVAAQMPARSWNTVPIAALAALIFMAHPAQVYTVAYVSEQELILATLCGVLGLLAWVEGLRRGAPWLLWLIVPAYAGAMLCKENLLMVPALAVALTLLLAPWSWLTLRRVAPPALGLAVIGLLTIWALLQITDPIQGGGHPVTRLAVIVSQDNSGRVGWGDSALTQAGFFFRYGLIWLFPEPGRMAIDIQLPLVTWPAPITAWLWAAAFLAWPLGCLALLARRGVAGLVGFGLLWPWLHFLPEFTTVRATEAFVLYRLYPWMIGPVLVLAIAIAFLARRWAMAVGVALVVMLAMLSQGRLATFASLWRVWDDAVAVNRPYETTSPAAHRAWLNRGTASLRQGRARQALADYDEAARLAPTAAEPQLNRAVALQRLGQPEAALAAQDLGLRPGHQLPAKAWARALANRAAILHELGRAAEALAALEEAAQLDDATVEYRANAAALRASLGQ